MAESVYVQPLDAEEIKNGIVTKVAEALWEALNKTCSLYGVAYPKFSVQGKLECRFDNFGTSTEDIVQFSVDVDIPETPPNVFRKETGQGVPQVIKKDDGGTEQKAIIYRRPRRG